MKRLTLILAIGFFSLMASTSTFAQDKKQKAAAKEAAVKTMVDSKKFTFIGEYALPLGGTSIYIQPNYDVKFLPDTVTSFLPYFGRAFVAPMNPSESGIKFTSTKFDYNTTRSKKGNWTITFKPSDVRDVRQFFLTVTPSGYATLQVTSTNRTPISFNGYITEPEKPKS